MNLEGKIVKYNVPEEYLHLNNGTPTAPAVVVTDWNPDEQVENKLLNLKILYDGDNTDWQINVKHKANRHTEFHNWELYD